MRFLVNVKFDKAFDAEVGRYVASSAGGSESANMFVDTFANCVLQTLPSRLISILVKA